jgi:adenylate cyclase
VAPQRAHTNLVIGFLDLRGFSAVARRLDDDTLARVLDEFYRLVDAATRASGGDVIKFMGDGALLTWPEDLAGEALGAAFALRARVQAWARERSLDTDLVVRLHSGEVISGFFGPAEHAHRDIIGKPVFVAAKLEARTISVSAEFFRRLDPVSRERLKKHTPPVVYIPAGDPRP